MVKRAIPQSGDVVTMVSKWGLNPIKWILYLAIHSWQKRFFGSGAYWKSTHVLICTGENELFEVTAPKSRFTNFEYLKEFRSYRIYQYGGQTLNALDLQTLRRIAEKINGSNYDYLDLLDFLVYEVLGYPKSNTKIFTGIFGLGKKKMVCSTGIAVIWRSWRNTLYPALPKLFAGTPVELTSPAHFDNYPSDFIRVG